MFIVKKIVSAFLMPVPMLLIFLFFGLFLLWFTQKQRTGRAVVTLGVIFLFLMGFSPLADKIMVKLERVYPAYESSGDPVDYIVVLGGGSINDPEIPAPSRLGFPSLYRVTEGIRIHRMEKDSKLIFSGASRNDTLSSGEVAAKVAMDLGVAPENIIIEKSPRDTREESEYIRKIVGTSPFVLVTSASHMKRAMDLFRDQGMNPIPAPAGHNTKLMDRKNFQHYFPNPISFYKFHRIIYEGLGIAWNRIRYGI